MVFGLVGLQTEVNFLKWMSVHKVHVVLKTLLQESYLSNVNWSTSFVTSSSIVE